MEFCDNPKNKKLSECKVLRPIIPYFGGKTKVAKKIVARMPPHRTFIEPMIGGGSVYWANTKANRFVINDLDKDVYKLYKLAKNKPSYVKSCKLNPSKNKFNKIKDKFKHNACDVMLLYKHSYGADGKCFAKHQGLRNNTFTDAHKNKLKKTKISNEDFRKIIKNYDKKGNLIYLDPPYIKGGKTYKVHGITPKEVCDSVKKLKKSKVIISYDKNKKVKENCRGLKFSTISFNYSNPQGGGTSDNKKTEYLITNY